MKRTWVVLFCALILEVKCQSKLRRWQDGTSFDTGGNNIRGHSQLGYVGTSNNLNSYSGGNDVNGYGGNMNTYNTGNDPTGFDTGGGRGSGLNEYGSDVNIDDYGGGGSSSNSGGVTDYGGGADMTGYGGNNEMNEYSGGDSRFPGNDVNAYSGFHSNDMAGFDGNSMANFGGINGFSHNPWEGMHRQVKTVVKHTVKNIAVPHPVPAPVHVPVPKYVRYFKPFPVAKPVAIPEVIPVVKHIQKPIAYFTSIPVARSVPVPKFIGLPVQVRVPRPIVIRVPKLVPVAKKFAVPITVHVPKPYVVPVYQQVPVPVPHKVPKIINIVKEVPHIVKKPIPIYVDEHGRTEFAPSNAISNYISNGGFSGRPHNDFNSYNSFDSEEEYNDGYEHEYDIHPPHSPGYTNSFGETFNQYQKYPQQSSIHTKPRAHRLPKNPQHSSTTSTKSSSIDSPKHNSEASSKNTNKPPGMTSAYELSLDVAKNGQASISSSSSSSSQSNSMSTGNQQMSQYRPSAPVTTSGTSTSIASQPYSQNVLSTFAKNLQNMASMYAKAYPSDTMNNHQNQYSFEYHNPSTGSTTSQFFSSGANLGVSQFGNMAQQFPQSFRNNLKNTFENTYNSGNIFSNLRNNNNNQGMSYSKYPSTFSNQLNKQTAYNENKNNYVSQSSSNIGTPQYSYNQNSVQEPVSNNFEYSNSYNPQSYTTLLNTKPRETEISHAQGYSQLHQTSNFNSNNPFSTQYQNIGDNQLQKFTINHKVSKLNANNDQKLSSSYNNPSNSAYVSQNLNYYDAIYNSNNNEGYKNIKPQESNPDHSSFSNGYYYNHYQNNQEADNKPFFTNSGTSYASEQNQNMMDNQNDPFKTNEVDILRTYSGSHSTSQISSVAGNNSSLKNTFLSNSHGNHQQLDKLDNHKPASTSDHKKTATQQGYLENHKSHGQSVSTNSDNQDNQAHSSSHSHAVTSVQMPISSFPQISAIDSVSAAYQSAPYSQPVDETYQHASRFDEILSSSSAKLQSPQSLNKPQTSSSDISKFYSAPDPLADYIASVSNSDESSSQDQILSSSELIAHHKLKQDPVDSRIQMTPWNSTHTSTSIITQLQNPNKLSPSYWSPPLIVSPSPMSASSTAFSIQNMKIIKGPNSAEKKDLAMSTGQANPVYKPATDAPQYKTSISVAYQVAENLPLKTSR